MVRLQKMLVNHLGIGGCLRWRADRWAGCRCSNGRSLIPDAVRCVIPIATTSRHSAQQIAFNEVGRQAIMADPDWNDGDYYDKKPPARGLSVARMVGHITYMSDDSMREKFGRRFRDKETLGSDFSVDFEVESYLRYRGSQFVDRFDANSYLYITKAMDLLRSDQRPRVPGRRVRAHAVAISGDQLYVGLAVSDVSVARRSSARCAAVIATSLFANCNRTMATMRFWSMSASKPS